MGKLVLFPISTPCTMYYHSRGIIMYKHYSYNKWKAQKIDDFGLQLAIGHFIHFIHLNYLLN